MEIHQWYCIFKNTISMPVNGAIQVMSGKIRWYFCFNKNGCVKNDLLELHLCVFCQTDLQLNLIHLKCIWTDFVRTGLFPMKAGQSDHVNHERQTKMKILTFKAQVHLLAQLLRHVSYFFPPKTYCHSIHIPWAQIVLLQCKYKNRFHFLDPFSQP